MTARTAKKLLSSTLLLATFTLGGCAWFDQVGENFPVIGDRCEYWQCFTAYGQQQSDLIKEQRAKAKEDAANAPPSNAKPINAPGDIPPGATGYNTPATTAPASTGATTAPQSAQHHVEFLDPSKIEPIEAPSDPSAGWLR